MSLVKSVQEEDTNIHISVKTIQFIIAILDIALWARLILAI